VLKWVVGENTPTCSLPGSENQRFPFMSAMIAVAIAVLDVTGSVTPVPGCRPSRSDDLATARFGGPDVSVRPGVIPPGAEPYR